MRCFTQTCIEVKYKVLTRLEFPDKMMIMSLTVVLRCDHAYDSSHKKALSLHDVWFVPDEKGRGVTAGKCFGGSIQPFAQ